MTKVTRASLCILALTAASAHADSALPYTTRSKSFSAYNSSVRGDIRTVGMSGATMGLADTFIAGTYNPAGLAMALDNADANFASQTVHDGAVQSYASTLSMNNVGACLNQYPWGFSLGYAPRPTAKARSTHPRTRPPTRSRSQSRRARCTSGSHTCSPATSSRSALTSFLAKPPSS